MCDFLLIKMVKMVVNIGSFSYRLWNLPVSWGIGIHELSLVYYSAQIKLIKFQNINTVNHSLNIYVYLKFTD